MFCDGGLFACSVCGALEGATPTECPGTQMDTDTVDLVYAGDMDFVQGAWRPQPSPYSPPGVQMLYYLILWMATTHAFKVRPELINCTRCGVRHYLIGSPSDHPREAIGNTAPAAMSDDPSHDQPIRNLYTKEQHDN